MAPGDVGVILRRLDDQDEVLNEIKAEAKKTNGRVTNLEREQLRREEREKILKEFAAAQVVAAEKDEERQVRRQDTWQWRVGQVVAVLAGAGILTNLDRF
jgi:hypothetical protein